jgi:hypothetical protein
MTDLEDALNSSAPMFDQVEVIANWQELPPGYTATSTAVDSLEDLGSQVGPNGYTVKQSFDDGLPDPVTMSTSLDASGSMGMDLVGRPPNIADLMGLRASSSGSAGASTSVSIPNTTGVQFGDYQVVAIVLNNLNAVTDTGFDPTDIHGWTLLASQQDVTIGLWVYGRRFYTAAPPLALSFASASYSWVSTCWFATTWLGSRVDIVPGTPVNFGETVSQTTHTLPTQNVPSRGWALGIFASPSAGGVWTPGAGNTEIVEIDATTNLMLERSALLLSSDAIKSMSATTAVATSTVAGIGLPLLIADRQYMDAMAYFSPFNEDSPIIGFERDTAPLRVAVNVVTAVGVIGTNIFTGQMADIQLQGRTANLTGVSSTRIRLDKALTLPTVFGDREGCSVDWLVSWIAARGGQYAGVAPSAKTRFWVPMHGSVHPHMTGNLGYAAALIYDKNRSPTGPFGLRPPGQMQGPFYSAMFAQQKHDFTYQLAVSADRPYALDTEVPGIDNAEINDFLSAQNSEGRVTFWIKGDPSDGASPLSLASDPTNNWLFDWFMFNPPTGATIRVQINPTTRNPVVRVDSTLTLTGGPIPNDGLWHFCGFIWQYATGLARFRMDNVFWDLSGFTTSPGSLPASDLAQSAGPNGSLSHALNSHLPLAEFQVETGPGLYTEQFARFWPTPTAPSLNMLTRATFQWIEDVAEVTPLQGWTALQELAQATASWMRVNEDDNLEFLPLRYFGEDDQLTPADVMLDTETNAADLDVTNDPTLTRNVVTVEFEELRTFSNRTQVMQISAPIAIPPGVTDLTFPLDLPAAELHGAAQPYTGATWNMTKLTALQIAGTNPLPNEHFMSVNAQQDGGGAVYTAGSFTARITNWDSSTVVLRFINSTGVTKWLANNGTDIPFLRILGYAITAATGYSTVSDPGSVGKRRERALTTQAAWITRRAEAEDLANRLIAVLSQPRVQVTVRVMGDPTRRPGNLVSLLDANGTRADGTWRILAITHNGAGPQYTQDLQLLAVPEVLIWDQGNWDETVWGA